MINKASLLRFLKFYFYRLNNGVPRGSGVTSAEEFSENSKSIPVKKEKKIINIILFIATLCSTTLAGAVYDGGIINAILSGLPYSLTLM